MALGALLLLFATVLLCCLAAPAGWWEARSDAGTLAEPPAERSAECDPRDAPHGPIAFPGAEGFGRFARGGRGGRAIAVTSLADGGPGSLRACAEASGARTCMFRVSGTIVLDDWIRVLHPFLTIAGQTSPGGIALRNGASGNAPMLIQTHDVIVRHLRLRPGASPNPSTNVDTIQISGGAHDVILDHLSTSWPTDEGINIVGSGHAAPACGQTRNVTVQWSILSEGLDRANRGRHSRGSYFGYGAEAISFHHNLIASNARRNPLINTRGQFDLINNVIYNSGTYNAEVYTRFGDLGVNAIGNVALVGPASDKTMRLYLIDYFRDFPADFAIYLRGNLDIHRPQDRGDEQLVLEPGDRRHASRRPIGTLSLPPGAIDTAAVAYGRIAAGAGATRPVRDAVDRRVIGDMLACRGAIIDSPEQVGGWPALVGPPAPADRDGDGMPDDWEAAHGLDPAIRDGHRAGADGFTELEHYLASLAAGGEPGATTGPPRPACGFAIADRGPTPSIALAAEPSIVAPGGAVTLHWSGSAVRACKIDGKAAGADGARVVRPDRTRVYEIDCTGLSGGDAIDSVLVSVRSGDR